MAVTIDGSNGISTPDLESAGPITGTTGTFSGNVTVNGLSTELRPLVLGTVQASTSGTAIDFTGIPSWVKRVTVMLSGVSTSGTSLVQVQLGDSGGFETTGYIAGLIIGSSGGVAGSYASTGFICYDNASAATNTISGSLILSTMGSNIWCANGSFGDSGQSAIMVVGGAKTLSDTLTQIRVTTVNGTDTFDAGTINIMYE